MAKKTKMQVRITPTMQTLLKRAADAQKHSVSSMTNQILREYFTGGVAVCPIHLRIGA